METQTVSSSSSSSTPYWKYDVFINFRGTDIRHGFIGHLSKAFERNGIIFYKDDINLPRGNSIEPDLFKSIEESKFAIVVLSTNYANSTWCLTELEKIVERMKQNKLTILPVFYHVNPSDARNQMGILATRDRTFAEAFAEHEKRFNIKQLQVWKAALKEVGNIAGWHVQQHR